MWVEGQGGIQSNQYLGFRFDRDGGETYNYVRYRSDSGEEKQGALMMSLSVTNAWFSSTRTFGSLIRGGPCGASAVYTVSLRLARRTPECMGTGCCSPIER